MRILSVVKVVSKSTLRTVRIVRIVGTVTRTLDISHTAARRALLAPNPNPTPDPNRDRDNKGVLAMAGCDDKYVYQGVHMLFTGEVLEPG